MSNNFLSIDYNDVLLSELTHETMFIHIFK